jgi:hypothetical protein
MSIPEHEWNFEKFLPPEQSEDGLHRMSDLWVWEFSKELYDREELFREKIEDFRGKKANAEIVKAIYPLSCQDWPSHSYSGKEDRPIARSTRQMWEGPAYFGNLPSHVCRGFQGRGHSPQDPTVPNLLSPSNDSSELIVNVELKKFSDTAIVNSFKSLLASMRLYMEADYVEGGYVKDIKPERIPAKGNPSQSIIADLKGLGAYRIKCSTNLSWEDVASESNLYSDLHRTSKSAKASIAKLSTISEAFPFGRQIDSI